MIKKEIRKQETGLERTDPMALKKKPVTKKAAPDNLEEYAHKIAEKDIKKRCLSPNSI